MQQSYANKARGIDKAVKRNNGAELEQLTQQVFQTILDQDQVQNIEVERNVRLAGVLTSHQIDIFWEFIVGEIRYRTLVEVKDWKETVDQAEILKFRAVLDDLPGQPRGIIVSQSGFQAGARRIAAANGIVLYELRKLREADLNNRVSALVLNLVVSLPSASDIHLEHDENWRRSEALRLGLNEAPRLQLSLDPPETKLFDNDGKEIGTVQAVIDDLYPKGLLELAPIRVRHAFNQPTFLETHAPSFPRLKVVALRVTICSSKIEQEVVLDVNEFVDYVLKETLTGAVQAFDHHFHRRLSDQRRSPPHAGHLAENLTPER